LDTLNDWLDDAKLASIQLPGFGDAIRNAIRAGLNDNRELIAKLLKNGVSVQSTASVVIPDSNLPFAAFSFCLTGTRECIDDIERLGGSIKSGVSKGLTFLVQKDALSASNKTKKAEELGTIVISLDHLKRAIAGEVTLTCEPKDDLEYAATHKAAVTATKHVKPISKDIDSLVDQLVD
jgi:DNA ligase (NAD+)